MMMFLPIRILVVAQFNMKGANIMNRTSLAIVSESDQLERDRFNQWFKEEFEKESNIRAEAKTNTMALIATKGTLDWAYPPFILASTASALGWEVSIFFSFYGLELLKKDLQLGVSPLGNPAMPMKMPIGPEWFRGIDWKIPNIVMGNIPGFELMAKSMFNSTLKQKGVASIEELRSACIEAEVKLVACQMTVDLFGYSKTDFVPEVAEWVGAASFLPLAAKADVCLYI
ncbi:sulfur carrier protein DsrE2 [Sulfurirhabdus autotrophica]|uniref:sulfur carrier protein DsrE2 n=1 Tax=Sulfurirhabdus autotrophica TaxID=1706046 RepID=UPI003F94C63F